MSLGVFFWFGFALFCFHRALVSVGLGLLCFAFIALLFWFGSVRFGCFVGGWLVIGNDHDENDDGKLTLCRR